MGDSPRPPPRRRRRGRRSRRAAHADRGADRFGQDAGGLPRGDRRSRAPGLEGRLPDATQVVYVSPLKALSNDIQRNLEAPLAGIREELRGAGLPDVEIRTWVRTGDTPSAERDRMRRRPPHILVTTPESLYILLGSESGRKMLATHADGHRRRNPRHRAQQARRASGAVAGAAGGAVRRRDCCASASRPRRTPIETGRAFLVGAAQQRLKRRSSTPATSRAARPGARGPGLAAGGGDVGARSGRRSMTGWPRWSRRIAPRWSSSTRGAWPSASRAQLSERLGEDAVTAHHGSMAKEQRLVAEQRLKRGALKVLVATASLELGIDIGDVDLVCQLGSPRSIASFPATGRALRPRRRRHAEGAAVSAVARRTGRMRGAARQRAPRRTRPADDPGPAAGRARAADRRRSRRAGMERGRTVTRCFAAPGRIARCRATNSTTWCACWPKASHPPRPARRADPSRCGQSHAARPARRAPDRADLRRHHSRHRRLSGRAGAGEPVDRLGQRGFRRREHGRRHIPARQQRLSHHPGRARRRCASRMRMASRRRFPFWLGEAPGRSDELSRSVSRLRAEIADASLRSDRLAAAGRRSTGCAEQSASARPAAEQLARISRRRSRGARLPADPGHHRVRALLRRSRRHAAGHPCALRQPDQPRLGPGAAQALLPQVQFRTAGGGDRGQYRAVAHHGAQFRTRRRGALSALGQRAADADPGDARRADVRHALALGRRHRAGAAAVPRRQEGAAATRAHGGRGSDRRRCSPISSPAPRTWSASARCPTIRWSIRRSPIACTRRWTSTGWSGCCARIEAGEIGVVALRSDPALAAGARGAVGAALRLSRRCAARGAANPGGDEPALAGRRRAPPTSAGWIPQAIERVRAEAWPDPANADELHDALLWLGCLPRPRRSGGRDGRTGSTRSRGRNA